MRRLHEPQNSHSGRRRRVPGNHSHDGESAGVTIRDELTKTLNHADIFEGGDSVFMFLAGRMEPLKFSKPFYDRYIYRRQADKNPIL